MHASPNRIFELLAKCAGKRFSIARTAEALIFNPMYRACYRKHQNLQLTNYLMRGGRSEDATPIPLNRHRDPGTLEQVADSRVERAILDMILSKLKAFREAWTLLLRERTSNIGPDIVQIVTSLCAVASAFAGESSFGQTSLCREISALTEQVWDVVCKFVSQQEGEVSQVYLTAIGSTLLTLRVENQQGRGSLVQSVSGMVSPVIQLLRESLEGQRANSAFESDLMDMEDSFVSQNTLAIDESRSDGILREDLPFFIDVRSYLVRITVDLLVDQALADQQKGADPATLTATMDFVLSLSSVAILATREPLMRLLTASRSITRSQACRILEKLAGACMQDDNFERCEASLCLCLEALSASVRMWTAEEEDELAGTAADMYTWFLEVALGKSLASSRVLMGIARLLEAVLTTNASFSSNSCSRSPRTSMFQILQSGDNTVKFEVAERICRIFERFVLTEHEAIFDDILDYLPSDPANPEGIAVRLFVLAELAARWHTLRRRSIYHLFETPAHIPSSVEYAKHCLQRLCHALSLASPREVFILFSPQILYTWLEKETIHDIPFTIYGYDSLQSLLFASQNEIVGQIAMRGSRQQAETLSQILSVPWEDMLKSFFAKAEAYTIARDISMPPQENQAKSAESVVRKQLGTDDYMSRVRGLFPDIVATLFVATGEEHGFDRALAKREGFASTKEVLVDIRRRSHSDKTLPPGQQPSFRARYLLDDLEFLCQRINVDVDSIWTAPLTVHVLRTLFDSAVPCLGPLHACVVLRKVRIVVALAGQTLLVGYPLEMLLHTIRPYLTQFHCTEDALGIYWYLLDKGRTSLQSRSAFMAGLAVSTFSSLSKFVGSSQDSTTQESHFQATMSQAQSFRAWFGRYMETFQPSGMAQDMLDAFGRIVHSARNLSGTGSAVKGSHEGDLTFELMNDRTSERRLLTQAAFDSALELSCSEFTLAPQAREDILGDNIDAASQAPVIWDIILRLKVGVDFRTWAAEVLGRAYASTGRISDKLSREQDVTLFGNANESAQFEGNSDVLVLSHLQVLLGTDSSSGASLAEKTLQMVITRLTTEGKIHRYESNIDSPLISDLNWKLLPCPPLISDHNLVNRAVSVPNSNTEMPIEKWASELAIALCLEMSKDSILGPLPAILSQSPQFSQQIIPAIVHKALLSDISGQQKSRHTLSSTFSDILKDRRMSNKQYLRLVNSTILFLRCQPLPTESTMADRNSWLEIDFGEASAAAVACNAPKTALLFLELQASRHHLQIARSSRRSSTSKTDEPFGLMQSVFESLDDPDFFYGAQEQVSMDSVLKKLGHEGASLKNLSFQSAVLDSNLKCSGEDEEQPETSGVLSALSAANLHGVARAVQINSNRIGDGSTSTSDSILSTALNLHQWDLPGAPSHAASVRTVLRTFHQLNVLQSKDTILQTLNEGLLANLDHISSSALLGAPLYSALSTLTILSEIKETLTLSNSAELDERWLTMEAREHWMDHERYLFTSPLLSFCDDLLQFRKNLPHPSRPGGSSLHNQT